MWHIVKSAPRSVVSFTDKSYPDDDGLGVDCKLDREIEYLDAIDELNLRDDDDSCVAYEDENDEWAM